MLGGYTAQQFVPNPRGIEGTGENIGKALYSIKVGFNDVKADLSWYEEDEAGHEPILGGYGGSEESKGMNEEIHDRAEQVMHAITDFGVSVKGPRTDTRGILQAVRNEETGKRGLLDDIRQT